MPLLKKVDIILFSKGSKSLRIEHAEGFKSFEMQLLETIKPVCHIVHLNKLFSKSGKCVNQLVSVIGSCFRKALQQIDRYLLNELARDRLYCTLIFRN